MPNDWRAILAIGAVGLVAYYVLTREAIAAVKTVGHAINPVNNDNIFASGVNAVGESLSGRKGWNLGAAIYDWTH